MKQFKSANTDTVDDYLLHSISDSLFIGLCDQALARLTSGCCYSAYCSGMISYRPDVLPVARPIVSKH